MDSVTVISNTWWVDCDPPWGLIALIGTAAFVVLIKYISNRIRRAQEPR